VAVHARDRIRTAHDRGLNVRCVVACGTGCEVYRLPRVSCRSHGRPQNGRTCAALTGVRIPCLPPPSGGVTVTFPGRSWA